MSSEVKAYLAAIGRRGGKTKGASKVRGDADYYKKISQKAVAARKKKAARPARKSDSAQD